MMATARQRADWDRTAVIWSLLVNAHSDPKKQIKPAHPADIHPFRERSDYDAHDHDEDYHHDRRLMMLPPTERARVAAALRDRNGEST